MDPVPHETPAPGRVIDVAAGLVFRRGRLLITQRRAGTHLAGLWEFPGGKVDDGETFEQGLVRELREELGIHVHVHELWDDITHVYPGKTVRLRFYRCSLPEGEPEAIECAAIAWVSADELDGFSFPEADAHLLKRLKNGQNSWPLS